MPTFATDGPVGKLVRKMSTSSGFRRIGPKVVPPLDRAVYKLTRGRYMVSAGMVPVMILTTTGQKSGLERQSPLACVPEGDGWYVVGSNFARPSHPAWTGNLIAHPRAKVGFRGRTYEVDAHLLTDEEKAETWPRLTKVWPAYEDYTHITDRNIRVFRLTRV